MGNRFICMTKKDTRENGRSNSLVGSRSKRVERSKRRSLMEEELLHRQALSMAIQQHQLSQRFEGSMSRRIGSTSSRRRNDLSESFPASKQVLSTILFTIQLSVCVYVYTTCVEQLEFLFSTFFLLVCFLWIKLVGSEVQIAGSWCV